MIDHVYDYDNQFIRMILISLAKTLTKSIRWINYFKPKGEETGRTRVLIPFYSSLTGEERTVLDAFVDDIVDKRVTMNTNQFQRGMIIFNGFSTRSNEFANPNQYLAEKKNINGVLRKIISKVKAVPVTLSFDIEIQLATQNEVAKCSQKILDMFYNYMFFNIDYYGLKIDALITLPDDKSITINREINYEADRKKEIKFSLDVNTHYPIFKINSDDLIVCDNDGDIDWDRLDVPRPTVDFEKSLKNYNKKYNIMAGHEGMGEIKRCYYEAYYSHLSQYGHIDDTNRKKYFMDNYMDELIKKVDKPDPFDEINDVDL